MSREDNIYKARLAEQGERYEDMIKFMTNVASVSIHDYSLHCSPLTNFAFCVVWTLTLQRRKKPFECRIQKLSGNEKSSLAHNLRHQGQRRT